MKNAVRIRQMFVIAPVLVTCVACGLAPTNVGATVVNLYADLTTFQNALVSFGLVDEVIDFETQTDGSPVPSGNLAASSPLAYSIFGGTKTATFSTGSSFVYEDFASTSPSHSLREDASAATNLAYSAPVAAIGAWILDIDALVADAATVIYHTIGLGDISQVFDNSGGATNTERFFGAISTNDAMTAPVNILTGGTYDLSNASTPEFTYLDDVRTAMAMLPVPEPTTLALTALGLAGLGFRRRKLH